MSLSGQTISLTSAVWFQYIDSTIPLAILYGYTAQFMSDLIGYHEYRFSNETATLLFIQNYEKNDYYVNTSMQYDPRCEKTGLRGFRHKPGCTTTEE